MANKGYFILTDISGYTEFLTESELLGADVIVSHRMLKNSVIEMTGVKTYALFSEAAKISPG